MSIEINKLVRRNTVFEECIAVIDNTMIAKETCSIIVPFRFLQARLLEIGNTSYCATVFPLVNTRGEYQVSAVCTKMEITPSSTTIIKHDGDEHYVFTFDKGAVITPSIDLIVDGDFSYLIYDELIQKAKAPWFLTYKDLARLMSTVKSHAGMKLSDTNAVFELIISFLSKDETMTKQYREVIKSLDDSELAKHERVSIPINSVTHGVANKMNKIMGGYTEDGLTSALTSDTSPVSGVELLLRKQ